MKKIILMIMAVVIFAFGGVNTPPQPSSLVVDSASFRIVNQGSVIYTDSAKTDSTVLINWVGKLSYSAMDDELDSMGVWLNVVIDGQIILVDSMWGDYTIYSGVNKELNFSFSMNHLNWDDSCAAKVELVADDLNRRFPTKVYYSKPDFVKMDSAISLSVDRIDYPYGRLDSLGVDTSSTGGFVYEPTNSFEWTAPSVETKDYKTALRIIMSDGVMIGDTVKIPVVENGAVLAMKLIAAGSHLTEFTISSEYYMDSTEVTQGMYHSIMSNATTGYTAYTKPSWNDSIGKGDNYPAYNVNWYDAVLFCNARSKALGLDTVYTYSSVRRPPGNGCTLLDMSIDYSVEGFRLPTEDEWELACRSGTTTDYYWGKDYDPYPSSKADSLEINNNAVWENNSENLGSSSSDYGSHEVASKLPNGNGLYDMSGNLWEWCSDWTTGITRITPRNDYIGVGGTFRVIRGGGWANGASALWAFSRTGSTPISYGGSRGFRCVLGSL